jgi:hypothetical protein
MRKDRRTHSISIISMEESYRRSTSWFCLWFWRNRCNAVAMVLASALIWEAFTLLKIFQMKDVRGVNTSQPQTAFWWRIMVWQQLRFFAESIFCLSLFCDAVLCFTCSPVTYCSHRLYWFIVHRARISLLDYEMFLNIKMSWGLCPSWQWVLMSRVGFSHAHTVHLRTKPMERWQWK